MNLACALTALGLLSCQLPPGYYPKPTPTPTPTATPKPTPTVTATPKPSPTPSVTPSPTPSGVPTIPPVASFTSPPGWLAMNIYGYSYYAVGAFTDAAHNFTGFFPTSSASPIATDTSGYPSSGNASAISYMAGMPVGSYSASWNGSGSINFRWSKSQTPTSATSSTVNYGTPGNVWTGINGEDVTYMDTVGQINNIHLYAPGMSASSSMYMPWFTQNLKGFSSIRTMPFLQVSSDNHVNWSDRVQPNSADWADSGVPYEAVIELVKEAGLKQVWVNVPINASDDYITQMATLFHSSLPAGVEVMVELSNEIWNWGGGFNGWGWANCEANGLQCATGVASVMGPAYYDGNIVGGVVQPDPVVSGVPQMQTDQYTRASRAAASKAYRMAGIWLNVYGDRPNDCSPLWAGQAGWNAWATNGLAWVKAKYGSMPFKYLAIAPYFDYNWNSGQYCPTGGCSTVPQILWAAYQNITKDIPGQIDAHKPLADLYGLKLVDYEGGQSFFLTNAANSVYSATDPASLSMQDPGMGILYDTYYQILQSHGVYRHFDFIYGGGPWSKWGYWNLFQSPADINPSNVRWAAIQRELSRQQPSLLKRMMGFFGL